MKRSAINQAVRDAQNWFGQHGWVLPPYPRWDVTDFGLGHFLENGLVLVNLAEEPEYCEKLMYARQWQCTPAHTHRQKKEDIICRQGTLGITVWNGLPTQPETYFSMKKNGLPVTVTHGETVVLQAGERLTITPGIYHAFAPVSTECIIGEVSTANDDLNDNFFVDERIGRFSQIEEDEPAIVKLVSDL
jgi:D-lyxose ketol-isomerase